MTRTLQFVLLMSVAVLASAVEASENWKFKTGGRVYSSPLLVGDTIYFGSGDANFYAVDTVIGKKRWSFETDGAVHSSAAVGADVLYFASMDGGLYAVSRKSGELIWKFESAGERAYGLWDYYLSSPVVEDNRVYWGSGDGHIYALAADSGQLIWKYDTGDVVHATPALDSKRVYVGGYSGFMYALNKESGLPDWTFRTVGASYFPKGEIQRGALVEDGVVYFGSRDYNMYALDAETGRGKWNMKQPQGWIIATPVSHDGQLFFGTSDAHIFYSMDKSNGTVNWTVPVAMRVYGSAVVSDGIVYFGTFDGKVLGVDHLTGENRWQFQTESSKANYRTIYKDSGEFRDDFVLYGLDNQTPEKMIHALGSVLSTPTIDNGNIYFGSSDGHLYSIRLK